MRFGPGFSSRWRFGMRRGHRRFARLGACLDTKADIGTDLDYRWFAIPRIGKIGAMPLPYGCPLNFVEGLRSGGRVGEGCRRVVGMHLREDRPGGDFRHSV
jgi:hypothetical protein